MPFTALLRPNGEASFMHGADNGIARRKRVDGGGARGAWSLGAFRPSCCCFRQWRCASPPRSIWSTKPTSSSWASCCYGTAGLFELAARASTQSCLSCWRRASTVVTAFLLIWINIAVGIIGDEGDPPNLMYAVVLGLACGGAIVAHFQRRRAWRGHCSPTGSGAGVDRTLIALARRPRRERAARAARNLDPERHLHRPVAARGAPFPAGGEADRGVIGGGECNRPAAWPEFSSPSSR